MFLFQLQFFLFPFFLKKSPSVGETTNLMQIDTQKFMDLCLYLNLVFTCPLQIGLAIYFLWNILGFAALAGNTTAVVKKIISGD